MVPTLEFAFISPPPPLQGMATILYPLLVFLLSVEQVKGCLTPAGGKGVRMEPFFNEETLLLLSSLGHNPVIIRIFEIISCYLCFERF